MGMAGAAGVATGTWPGICRAGGGPGPSWGVGGGGGGD